MPTNNETPSFTTIRDYAYEMISAGKLPNLPAGTNPVEVTGTEWSYACHLARIEIAHNNGEHGKHNPAEWAACHICLPDSAVAHMVGTPCRERPNEFYHR